nr:MAG TPA_asm: hypothetical protein [Caudoviricetes sp.]
MNNPILTKSPKNFSNLVQNAYCKSLWNLVSYNYRKEQNNIFLEVIL